MQRVIACSQGVGLRQKFDGFPSRMWVGEEGRRCGNDLQTGLFKKSPGTRHVERMGDEDDAANVGSLEQGGREGCILG